MITRAHFGRQKHEIKETLFHVKSDDSINHHIYLMKKENKKISNLSAWQRQNNNNKKKTQDAVYC